MSLMDPLADALTNIRNNELQVKDSCVISPASKLIGEVLSTMQKKITLVILNILMITEQVNSK